jgi:hypothetical protein
MMTNQQSTRREFLKRSAAGSAVRDAILGGKGAFSADKPALAGRPAFQSGYHARKAVWLAGYGSSVPWRQIA